MKKPHSLLAALLVLGALAHASIASAADLHQNFGRPGRPAPYPGPGRPTPPAPPAQGNDFLVRILNQRLAGDNTLALRQLLNIGPEFRGRRIQYVMLRARTDAGRGQAVLLTDGRMNGYAQTVGIRMSDVTFTPDFRDTVIGQDFQTLQLQLRGNFDVESVAVKLEPCWGRECNGGGGGGFPGTQLNQVVQRQFQGMNSISLNQLFRLDQFRGMRVRSVTIRASTRAGQGQASVCGISGCSMSQTVGTFLEAHTFQLNEFVDNNLRIELRGNFWVDSVQIELAR